MDVWPQSPTATTLSIDELECVPGPLPKQLEMVKCATEFPTQRHRWNTNEEVAALLVAFEHHAAWESHDVHIRPPSGAMLLYNRKKARYRKDGYCWKKRRDGKTTREDHMKLKVQGIECIYGCYVHSAILPTFHRRCYWLLQNPDIVLVHYLNVPLTDNNRLCLPPISLQQLECRDWSHASLVSQLRPMFASIRHLDVTNSMDDIVEEAIQSLVKHLMSPSGSVLQAASSSTAPVEHSSGVDGSERTTNIRPAVFSMAAERVPSTPAVSLTSNTTHSRLLHLIHSHQAVQSGSVGIVSSECVMPAGGTVIHQQTIPPLIFNVPMAGSSSFLILSNQAVTSSAAVTVTTGQSSVMPAVAGSLVAQSWFTSQSECIEPTSDNNNLTTPGTTGETASSAEFIYNEVDSKMQAADLSECSHETVGLIDVNRSAGNFSLSDEMHTHCASENEDYNAVCDGKGHLFDTVPADSFVDLRWDAGHSVVEVDDQIRDTMDKNCLDVLEDIFHIVKEGLGSDNDDDTSPNLSDDAYDLGLNDGLLSIGLVTPKEEPRADSDIQTVSRPSKITDYCPEWSYVEGGIKILVTGPWQQTSSVYTVQFGDVSVDATLVQTGVLRCYAPAHCPAVVSLQVACNGTVVSETCPFEYRSRESKAQKDWLCMSDGQLKKLLIQRLSGIEKDLDIASGDTEELTKGENEDSLTQQHFINWVEKLSCAEWITLSPTKSVDDDLTLLHMAAGLGYSHLITSLIKWREERHNSVLEQEIDSLCLDKHGNTPLMWACARGHTDAMFILHRWNPLALLGLAPNLPNSGCVTSTPGDDCDTLLTSGGTALRNVCDQSHDRSQHTDDELASCYVDNWLEGNSSSGSSSCSVSRDTTTPDREAVVDLDLTESCGRFSPAKMFNVTAEELSACLQLKDVWTTEPSADDAECRCNTSLRQLVEVSRSSVNARPPQGSSVAEGSAGEAKKRTRLMKRTSIDILPEYPQPHNDSRKMSKTASMGENDTPPCLSHHRSSVVNDHDSGVGLGGLRTSSSDSHLSGLIKLCGVSSGGDPMISRIDRDLNSPVMFAGDADDDQGFSLEDIQRETVAMDMESETYSDFEHSNQMMTLASQIIAAMPERIKLSPSQSKQLLADEINARRNRVSSYGSFSSYSSCSSSATPPTTVISVNAEDSGVSTPLDGPSFLEYRYNTDLGTPLSSALSPQSTCVLSPYSFDIDSPTPTAADFTEYFNAPATYMEKDFSQLTLSDEEQRRLYEAAKIIQSFYRRYKDKKEQQLRQQQKEIEAAILIQSYYRRYKQFMYYKRMTQAAVLIQSQFRSYYAQKRFRRSREAATIIQNRYRAYKEHERYKRSRNAAVIIQQRFRSHYQRIHGKQTTLANTVQKMMADRDLNVRLAAKTRRQSP